MKLAFSQLVSEEIELSPYSPLWPQDYVKERNVILNRINATIIPARVCMEHIGSTAVTGLSAKPIIDILLGVERLEQASLYLKPMTQLNYCYYPEFETLRPNMRFFVKRGPQGERLYHVQIVAANSFEWQTHVAFRDILRKNPPIARRYEQLKKKCAKQYRYDRLGYVRSKSEFIRGCLKPTERLAEINME